MKSLIGILLVCFSFLACAQTQSSDQLDEEYPIQKSEQEWKNLLSDAEYHVLREKGTERAFTHEYNNIKSKKGLFVCKACENVLFKANEKFNSGTGWPSFWDVAEEGAIEEVEDNAYGMVRTEVVCADCGGHLGHVFSDGPQPTGLRYCINGVSLQYQKK